MSLGAHAKLMFDLQVLAYQSDLTRTITFMMGRELSGRAFPEVGAPGGHHPTSHHQGDPVAIEQLGAGRGRDERDSVRRRAPMRSIAVGRPT